MSRRIVVDVASLRRDPAFRQQWIGQAGMMIGREASRVTLPTQVYLITGSPASIALLGLVQLAAMLPASIWGGALADSRDRRSLLVISQLAMAVVSLLMVLLAVVPRAPVELVLVLGFLFAGLMIIEQPTRQAAIPRLVPRERLTAAIALTALVNQASSVIGPAVAGLLIAVAGLQAAFVFQVLACLWAAVWSLRMPPLPPTGQAMGPRLDAIAAGFRYIWKQRLVQSIFAVDLCAMIFAMPASLFPVLAIDVFRIGPGGVGVLAAARGAGALLAAVFSGWIPSVARVGRSLILVVFVFAAATTLFGLSALSLPLALLFVGLTGATDMVSAVFRNAIVQFTVPDDLRGRVMATFMLSNNGGPRLGDIRAALMAEALGAQASVVVGGAIAMVGVGVVARLFPELRHYRTGPRSETPEASRETAARTLEAPPPGPETAEGLQA